MAKLGIMVRDNKYLDYVINAAKAANKKNIEVEIFFLQAGGFS